MYPEFADKTKETRLRTCETGLKGSEPVDLCRQDEVVLAQAADRVRPEVDAEGAVGQVEVGVVALRLGQVGDPIDELHARHEAFVLERLGQGGVALRLAEVPAVELAEQLVDAA